MEKKQFQKIYICNSLVVFGSLIIAFIVNGRTSHFFLTVFLFTYPIGLIMSIIGLSKKWIVPPGEKESP